MRGQFKLIHNFSVSVPKVCFSLLVVSPKSLQRCQMRLNHQQLLHLSSSNSYLSPMSTLIIANNLYHSCPDSVFLGGVPSISRGSQEFLGFQKVESQLNPTALKLWSFRTFSASSRTIYGGWDDFELCGISPDSGESDQLISFLSSIGINDKKYVVTFLLGLVCAFSISRVRVSSIVMLPASVLIFAIGFSFGFVRGGSFGEVSGSKRSKEEFVRFNPDKLRILVDFLDGLDAKTSDLKNDLQRAIGTGSITLGNLEDYVSVIKSMMLSISGAKRLAKTFFESVGRPHDISSLNNQKPSRRKKDSRGVGFESFQFIGRLFGKKEKSAGSDHSNVNNVTQESFESPANGQVEGRVFDKPTATFSSSFQDSSSEDCLNQDKNRSSIDLENGETSSNMVGRDSQRFINEEEYGFLNNGKRFVDNHRFSPRRQQKGATKTLRGSDNLLYPMDLQMETEASFIQEEVIKKSRRTYRKDSFQNKTSGSNSQKQKGSYYPDDPFLVDDDLPTNPSEINSSSHSDFADDLLFNRYLTEANNLLKEAKEELVRGRHNGEHADRILQKSASLLSEAISLKPMSLLAVGQLGNTYLLHGELKLRTSRELRAFLSRRDSIFLEKRGLDSSFLDKDKAVSRLINVCEECEELLEKAGRKYKMALSIDGNDMRALYNWGLALSFRAQLIADTGPEAALEADKLFMAAVDKFDAMMSKGNVYVPEALFRWGMALQRRSRLRPSNSKEKLKLLQQARRLFQDALHLDSDVLHVKEALSSCITELDYM